MIKMMKNTLKNIYFKVKSSKIVQKIAKDRFLCWWLVAFAVIIPSNIVIALLGLHYILLNFLVGVGAGMVAEYVVPRY